jgi:hypothetical protein
MKRLNLTFLFAIMSACAITANAQDFAFKVLANKGSNEVKSGDTWTPLKTGASIKAEDEIKVASNAYLGLVHKTGKPLELKEAKVYRVSELIKNISGSSSVVTKYTDFILSSNSPEAKKNHLSATGAVDRGEKADILPALPENQHSGIFNSKAIINWEGTSAPGPYKIIVKNMFDDEIAVYETPEASFQIDMTDPKIAKENAIIVQIFSSSDKDLESKTHLIKKLSTVDHDNVQKSLEAILGDVPEETPLNKIIIASFYEEKRLLIDAITAYEEAVRLEPAYLELYEEFLIRNDIKRNLTN